MPASEPLPPRVVVGAEALAALAVPARFAILSHLMAAGPRTATQCAAVTGETPSNCSWHLRALAKVGLVEPAEPVEGDARARPWRATAPGFDFSGGPGPAAAVARTAIAALSATQANDLYHRYASRQEFLPAEWTAASGANEYSLELTPDELESLLAAVDTLIRPYVRSIRRDAPPSSGTVHVTLRAFLDPDVSPDVSPDADLDASADLGPDGS